MSLRLQWFSRFLVLLTLSNASLFSQDLSSYEAEEQGAYLASQQAAHWSAYVPIVVIVGATIFFGVADQSHKSTSSHSESSGHEKYSRIQSSVSSYTCRGCYRNQAASHH